MRKLIFGAIFLLFFSSAYAAGKTYVFFTCDVESTSYGNPEKDIWGKRGSEYWGITRIMDILDKYSIKGTFFVNIYEAKKFGDDTLKKACQEIDGRGHDVELHTHPRYAFLKIDDMQDADLATQIEIIKYGKTLIYSWIGKNPVAHRAGAYAANENTLKACAENEIFIDSSRNYAYAKYQGLVSKPDTLNAFELTNAPNGKNPFIEIPVTVYYQFKFGTFSEARILDLESTSLLEFRKIFQEAVRSRVGTIVIISHSFSFSRYNPASARKIAEKMDQLMKLIKSIPALEPVTFTDFAKRGISDWQSMQNGNFMPTTGLITAYLKSWERLDQGKKNDILAFTPALFVCIGFITFIGVKKCLKKS